MRTAVENDRAYEARNSPDYFPRQKHLRAGPVNFSADLSYGLEWNDNIRLASGGTNDTDSDFLHVPQLSLRAMWQATRQTRIAFGMGVGYRKYMDNDDLSRASITPDSEFAIDLRGKGVLFTVYDRASYSQDVVNEGGISGTAQFPRLENTAGFRAIWTPDHWMFELGYGHFNFISDGNEFDYLSRSSEQLHARIAYRIAAITRVGIEASGSFTDYDNATRNDNESFSLGPFAEWQVYHALRVTARAGYVRYAFDPTIGRGLVPIDEEDPDAGFMVGDVVIQIPTLNGYYYGVDIDHDLTDNLSHRLSVDRSVQQGVSQTGGVSEQLRIAYDILWAFHRAWDTSLRGFFEMSEQPQRTAAFVNVTEKYDRWGTTLSLRWRPLDDMALTIGYRYVTKDSDFVERDNDYQQNVVFFRASYQF